MVGVDAVARVNTRIIFMYIHVYRSAKYDAAQHKILG